MKQEPLVLVVDDDEAIRTALERALRLEGFAVQVAEDGLRALELVEESRPGVIVLDVVMPNLSGITVVSRLRARGNDVPICVLSARDEVQDRVAGLEAGADDYVTKPFGLAELRSRIRAVLRRAQGRVVEGALTVGPVVLDRDLRRVTVEGEAVKLTFSEFELLACLMSRPGYAFNRQELLRAIWGDSAYRDPRAIDVHIRHLREKLEARPEEPSLILTVPGQGYRFRET